MEVLGRVTYGAQSENVRLGTELFLTHFVQNSGSLHGRFGYRRMVMHTAGDDHQPRCNVVLVGSLVHQRE